MKNLRIALLALLCVGSASGLFAQQIIFPQATAAPTVRFFGTTASTSRYYWVLTRYANGTSGMSPSAGITNGAATLTPSNQIQATWTTISGATGYDLLKTATNVAPTGACNCALVVNTLTPAWTDQGAASLTYTVPTAGILFPDATTQTTAAPGVGGTTSIKLATVNDTGNNLPVVAFTGNASAVNQVTVTNGATTVQPIISATGSDTNIDLKLSPKGSGIVNLPGVIYQSTLTITTANLNSGTSNTIVTGVTGRTLTPVGFTMQALGGNTATCTAVVMEDTAAVVIATEAIAGLTTGQIINEASAVANLTLGAGWNTALTTGEGIKVVQTGSACATATSFHFTVNYKIS